jgi:hypothetical protein
MRFRIRIPSTGVEAIDSVLLLHSDLAHYFFTFIKADFFFNILATLFFVVGCLSFPYLYQNSHGAGNIAINL